MKIVSTALKLKLCKRNYILFVKSKVIVGTKVVVSYSQHSIDIILKYHVKSRNDFYYTIKLRSKDLQQYHFTVSIVSNSLKSSVSHW
jgi:hypothetical protein